MFIMSKNIFYDLTYATIMSYTTKEITNMALTTSNQHNDSNH
jgi:hypothetical protein